MAIPSAELSACNRLNVQVKNDVITLPEYCYNMTIAIVSLADSGMRRAVELIPADLVPRYRAYLRSDLESLDFMPSPLPFIAGKVTDDAVNQMKLQLRPKYVRLMQLLKERAAGAEN